MLVLHIPHASTVIPPEIRDQFLLSDAELEAEIQAMTDHRTDELFAGLDGLVVAAEVSRLVVDVERFLDDPMEAVGMGAVYTRTSRQEPLRRTLSADEYQSLLDRYYHPHHARLTEAVRPGCLIVDCHSLDQTLTASYLNERASTIFGGAREVQKNIIAKSVLGL